MEACHVYSVEYVSNIKLILSSFMQHMGQCIFNLSIHLVVIVKICMLYFITIIK